MPRHPIVPKPTVVIEGTVVMGAVGMGTVVIGGDVGQW